MTSARRILAVLAAMAVGILSAADVRVGVIGTDTSHAIAFTRLMNVDHDPICAGFRVTSAYQWGSRSIVSSTNRYPRYVKQMREFGVRFTSSVAELLSEVDVVLLETNDGREHLDQALEVFAAGKPVFIDKPIAASLADAMRIVDAARRSKARFFSASSLRYMESAQAARAGAYGRVRGCQTWTSTEYEPTHSRFFWYGVHGAEALFTVMGRGCVEVSCLSTDEDDVMTGRWTDGRLGSVRGIRGDGCGFGGTIFTYDHKPAIVDMGEWKGYRPLLVKIVEFFKTGVSPIDPDETLEIFAFLEAAAQSCDRGGIAVRIADVMKQAGAK